MEALIELDREVLIYLNSFHASWLDPIMLFITKTFVWLPLYLFLLYLIILEYKKDFWIVLLGITITIALANTITSELMKPYFERLRPSRDPSLEGLLHLVKERGKFYKGGLYGFASSHAANTLGTAIFFFLTFRHTHRWIGLLFIWAVVMTYTRIYLGVHYPGDILVGGVIGILSGWFGFKLVGWITDWKTKRQANTL
jgi:undecaprenyl-diphosphatase